MTAAASPNRVDIADHPCPGSQSLPPDGAGVAAASGVHRPPDVAPPSAALPTKSSEERNHGQLLDVLLSKDVKNHGDVRNLGRIVFGEKSIEGGQLGIVGLLGTKCKLRHRPRKHVLKRPLVLRFRSAFLGLRGLGNRIVEASVNLGDINQIVKDAVGVDLFEALWPGNEFPQDGIDEATVTHERRPALCVDKLTVGKLRDGQSVQLHRRQRAQRDVGDIDRRRWIQLQTSQYVVEIEPSA